MEQNSFPKFVPPRHKILVADDDAETRDYLTRLLSPQYEVFAVNDGLEALRAVAEINPDLVLSDVIMPNLDGFGLLRALRSDARSVNTPIIILSARAGEEAITDGLQSGADAYIVKPFNARELLARVSGTLSLSNLRMEARAREKELKAEIANVLESITEGFVALDGDWRFTYVNTAAEQIYGTKREELVGKKFGEVCPAARATVFEAAHHRTMYQRTMTERVPARVEAWNAGLKNWFEVNACPLKGGGIGIYFRQITEQRRTQMLLAGKKEALELAVSGAPIAKVLQLLARTAEEQCDGARAAIFIVDSEGAQLRFAAAGGMAESYTRAVDGFPVGPDSPACGSAADTGQTIIVSDVETDSFWQKYLSFAREHEIRACWSNPIRSAAGTVLGMLTLYHRVPCTPAPKDLEWIRYLAHSAAILIERHKETQRRELAEQALRDSEARFRAAVQAHSRLLWTNNARGEMEGEQAAWSAFTGQNEDEYRGYGWSSAVHPEDAQPTIDAWKQAVVDRCMFNFEHRVRRHDGVWRLFSVRAVPVFNEQGGIREWVGVHDDITEARNAEEELRQSAARFLFIAESMPQKIFTAKPSGEVDYFNQQWMQFTGLTFEQIRDWGWTQFIHPDDLEENVRVWRHSIETGEPLQFVHRFRRADGTYRWHLSRAQAMRDAEGKISMWIGSNTEIHDERETQEALKRANADLEQFAYSASHDLQEPLRSVSIYSELLTTRSRDRLDGQALEFLGFLRSGALRMQALIRDLLAYTRATNLADVAPDQLADANEALSAAKANLATAIKDSGANITSHTLPCLPVHTVHLQQLIQNLIGNAIKYRSTEAPRIHLAAERRGEQWLFSVQDNGMGIDPLYKDRIFGLFQRLHTGAECAGTGLGLAICQRIVERYTGRIWVESEPGKGSTFHFTLPV